jgi:hypothetical protein
MQTGGDMSTRPLWAVVLVPLLGLASCGGETSSAPPPESAYPLPEPAPQAQPEATPSPAAPASTTSTQAQVLPVEVTAGQAQAAPPPPPSQPPPPAADGAATGEPPPPAQWVYSYPEGQWVYTADYGWIWVPVGAMAAEMEGVPYTYLYTPAYGWTWYVSPWGWGPYHYGLWVRSPWHPLGWRGGWVAHPGVGIYFRGRAGFGGRGGGGRGGGGRGGGHR